MNKLTLLFFLLLVLHVLTMQAKDGKIECDSSVNKPSISLHEVEITEESLNKYPNTSTIVSRDKIENRFEPSLLPLLVEETPSLFITSRGTMGYGVSSGSAGGMSMRGIGGSPTTGILVLIDGHPQYMGLMGHPLPDAYQSMMTEKVEILRGPASTIYGSNAIGGVINIITRKQEEGIKTGIKSMYGSYNTLNVEVNNSIRSGKFSSYATLNTNQTDGHRDNMNFEQYNGYIKLGYDFSARWRVFSDLNISRYESSNPGTVNKPMLDNDAEVTRGMTSLSIENMYDYTSGAFKFFYNFGAHEINDGYSEGGVARDYLFNSRDKLVGATLYQHYSIWKGNRTSAGVDLQHSGGHARNKFMDTRADALIINKSINEIAGYINFQQSLSNQWIFNTGIRLDHHSLTGNKWIPQASMSYLPTENTVLKAIVSKGFRNPTIRELYMFQPRNPLLMPESLINYEVSISQALLNNALNMGLNVYYIKGDNTIQIINVEGNNQYMNTGEIENKGVEISLNYRIHTGLSISTNYSWLAMKNKITASPKHKFYTGVSYSPTKKWRLGTGIQYINGLYTSVVPLQESKESFLLWNIRASYRPTKIVELFVRGENLLAQDYEINKGFPMPHATAFGGVNITL